MAHSPTFCLGDKLPAQEIEVVSPAETVKNEELLARVDSLIDEARTSEEKLHRDFLEIGVAMLEVQRAKAWLNRARSWDTYVVDCGKRFGRGRSALYGYVSVAERLLPHMPAKQLVEMGISKAQPLAQYVKQKGSAPPDSLVEKASDPNVGTEEFKAAVAETQHNKPEKGKWYDLGGFFCTPDERQEIDRVFALARLEIQLPAECPEWLERKLVFHAMTAECISTWEPNCTENV